MKNIEFLFLIFVSNIIFPMEVERKSLASFFDIDQFTQHEDTHKNIALQYLCSKQWWYVDKEVQFIKAGNYPSALPYQNYLRSVCFDSMNTKIVAFPSQGRYSACIWDRDGKELECLDVNAINKFYENNIEWADKLYNSGNSPLLHNYEDDIKELLEKRWFIQV